MKKSITLALLAICAVVLWNCSPISSQNYIVINKTKSYIGVNIDHHTIVATVEPGPYRTFEYYQKVNSHKANLSDFKLSNLNDTTSISVSADQLVRIKQGKVNTKFDAILYRACTYYSRYTAQWIVTDELLSIMTHDESLLTEFPYFYKK